MKRPVLAVAIGYQAVWLCAVAGAGRGLAWPGIAAAAAFVAAMLIAAARPMHEALLAAVAVLAGVLLDGGLAASGWLRYAAAWPTAAFAPAWILALWAAFATTLPVLLPAWLSKPLPAALFGAIGGPLAYLGAARGFDAVAFVAPGPALAALALGWAAALALLAMLVRSAPHAVETETAR
ncbi:MAG TPA: DUF2878 family protein [Dokdonella sp.]|uniref:DUF2878 family protein n=1 Tax=Dokdonella sp. TaxID=2291710 RepID=UPI002BAFB39B|nr:DUF2878 family protein [Dokdonella sp.]HUD40859.1 DUF2878 family protein [Dokdonella sp.]